jgi:hypothetical protein
MLGENKANEKIGENKANEKNDIQKLFKGSMG